MHLGYSRPQGSPDSRFHKTSLPFDMSQRTWLTLHRPTLEEKFYHGASLSSYNGSGPKLETSIAFYKLLGLKETRRHESEQGRFTLVFLAPEGQEDCPVERPIIGMGMTVCKR